MNRDTSYFTLDRRSALKIALIYVGFSSAWILFSDQILFYLVSEPQALTKIQTLKGWIFVLVTALLIFFLLQRELRHLVTVRQQLKDSEAKYRAVVTSTPDLLYRTDMDGRVVFVSPSVFALTGYSVGEALGMNLAREIYLHPEERETFLAELGRNGFVTHFEARLRRKDGTIWWASTNAHFYRDDQGQTLGVEGITRDVTRKKETEQAIEASEQRLSAILQANPDPMVMYDLKGLPLYLNPAFTQVFGWTFASVEGRRIPFVPDGEAALARDKITEIFETGSPLSFETRRLTRAGDILDVFLSAALIKDDSGSPYGMVVNLTDISEKKRLETQYEQAQKMESLGTLAGGIAHDFNNYLSGIFGYIDLAKKHASSPKVKDYLARALTSSNRARSLTHQLLTFSKGGAPVKAAASLSGFLEQTTRFALSGASVSCRFEIPESLWTCEYDKNQFSQVIDNVVINAHQAMPHGGEVRIRAENLVVDNTAAVSVTPGQYVRISISDTGTGIGARDLCRIFDPFFSTKPHGSGLGLATSYSIVKRHGGHIEVDSEPGRGTTFRILLPATGQTGGTPAGEDEAVDYRGSGTILIMDDEAMILDMLKGMLESMGFSVVSASHGKEALTEFSKPRNKPLKAVILDLTIPGGMGGKETVTAIRQMDQAVPVFLASGYSEDAAIANPGEFGFTASIEKPFLLDGLAAILKAHLS